MFCDLGPLGSIQNKKKHLWRTASFGKVASRIQTATLLKNTFLYRCFLSFAIKFVVSNCETHYISSSKPTQENLKNCELFIILILTHFLPMFPFMLKVIERTA